MFNGCFAAIETTFMYGKVYLKSLERYKYLLWSVVFAIAVCYSTGEALSLLPQEKSISIIDESEDFCASGIEEDYPVSGAPISKYDFVARRLAGLDAENNSESRELFETKWKNLDKDSLGAIKSWSQKNIIPHLEEFRTVFYPFGGPDISCPFKFFPSAHTYILVGFEPIGSFEEVSKNIQKTETLACLEKAFSSYLQRGYFITSEMSKDLSSNFLRGTLYPILPQLARLGFYISNVEDLSISPDGKEVARSHKMTDCIKITCKKDGDSAPRFVYYVSMSLENPNGRLPAFMSFMKKRSFVTFIKSSSYALHNNSTMSKFKEFLLANSRAILQDDTGVPFKDFLGEKWQKHAFGHYEAPLLKVFANFKQPDMAEFFKANSVASIPFKIGYGFDKSQPNLLLAVKNNGVSPLITPDVHPATQVVIAPRADSSSAAKNGSNVAFVKHM